MDDLFQQTSFELVFDDFGEALQYEGAKLLNDCINKWYQGKKQIKLKLYYIITMYKEKSCLKLAMKILKIGLRLWLKWMCA